MSCALCGTPTPELDAKCTFCRARDRFWLVLDDLPSELRGWAISNLRIWTGIVQEEHEKFTTLLRQREIVNNTAAAKSAGPRLRSQSPSQGRSVDPKDKAVDLKEEETRTSPPSKRAGVKEIEGVVEEEEGKHSSSSKAAKPKADTTSSRPRSRKRSRSRRRRDRSKSRRSRTRRDRSRSRKGRANDRGEGGKEKKAKPSVRPPRTPSRSPPKARGGPPPKRPPVERGSGPPAPVARPTGRQWTGTLRQWQRQPQYWGINKGQKKKEKQYYYRR